MHRELSKSLAISGCAVLFLSTCATSAIGQTKRSLVPRQSSTGAFVTIENSPKSYEIASSSVRLRSLPSNKSAPVITALSASADGRFLAAAGDDHAIRILDIQAGTVVRTLEGHSDWIQALCFASDSQTLYSAADDGRVLRWSHRLSDSFEEVARVPFAIRSICLSQEKRLLAIAGFSQSVLVLDPSSLTQVHQLYCDHGDIRVVRFSKDGTKLLAGGRQGDLTVWNASSGQRLAEFHEHRDRIYTAAFGSDGMSVTSAANDRQLIRYDLASRAVVQRKELGPAKLRSMCLINSRWIAVAGADNSVHLYDSKRDEVIAHLEGHKGTVAVMTPCGEFLASGSFDTTVRIWNLESIDADIVQRGKPISFETIKKDSDSAVR